MYNNSTQYINQHTTHNQVFLLLAGGAGRATCASSVLRLDAGVRFAALRLFVVVYVCAVESLNVFVHVVRFVRFVEGLPLMLQVENDDEKWLI